MENLSYLFIAYSAIWLVLFGYIFSLNRKQRDLEKQIKILEESVKEDR